MLREVINKHIKPRIVPFQATLSSTAADNKIDIGYGDCTLEREDTGTGTITLKEPFSRNSIIILGQSAITGGYAEVGFASSNEDSKASFPFRIIDESGNEADGTIDGFMFGWDNTSTSFSKTQRVASTQSAPRIIWGKVTGTTGAVSINAKDFGCTRTAAGTYTITFPNAFGKIPIVLVTGYGNTSTSVANRGKVTSKTATGCVVTMAPESGTPTDGDFYIMAIGCDSRSDAGKGRTPLQNSQRKPRIVAGTIFDDSGTPSISIGSATGGADLTTMVDGGTGDFSFTIAEAFAREPAIFLTTADGSAEVVSYTAGVVRFKTKDDAGDDADIDGVTSIFIIGTDVNETF